MLALAETKLDRDVLIQFLKIVSIYPTGTSVRLTNRETGVVVGQHRGLPTRPIIRIVKQDATDKVLEIKEIDLAKETTVFIEQVRLLICKPWNSNDMIEQAFYSNYVQAGGIGYVELFNSHSHIDCWFGWRFLYWCILFEETAGIHAEQS